MATLSNLKDIRTGISITLNGQPYLVVWADFMRTAQRKPVMRTKLRNLVTGQVLEQSFKPGDSVETADLEHKKAQFLYVDGETLWFMDNGTFEQFSFSRTQVGDLQNYVAEGQDVDVLYFEDKPVSVTLPPKVNLKVVEAPPGIKGDSATSPTKNVKLETGLSLNVPLFINQGDTIRVNTESGAYVERVNL